MGGSVLQIQRERSKTYLYTLNPSPINPRSQFVEHYLKIVDFYIHTECPENFIIEPVLGTYEPDIYFKDKQNKDICVEIQLTPISNKKMQQKIDKFVYEFDKNHHSKTLVLCSNNPYNKLILPKDFRLYKQPIPSEILL
jgi:hypothetical protein